MKKTLNNVTVEGLVYESTLEAKVSKAGKNYINGELRVQVTDTNIVSVGFYEGELTKAGASNSKYVTLMTFMNNLKTVLNDGADAATGVSIKSSNLRPEEYTVQELPRINWRKAIQQGGFVNVTPQAKLKPQAMFKNDVMVLASIREIDEATGEEKPYLTVKTFIFDYANNITPFDFVVYNPRGIEYFQSMTPNTFTSIWGNIESNTVKTQVVTDNAFGEALVTETERTTKQWVVTGVNTVPYGEDQMTLEDWNTCLQNRATFIANKIADEKERAANKAQGQINTAPQNQPGTSGFGGLAAGAIANTGGFAF